MLRISLLLNVVLIATLLYFVFLGIEQTENCHEETAKLEKTVKELRSKIANMQKKLYSPFGTPKPTFKEEALFAEEYTPPDKCVNKDSANNWVECVDKRKRALDAWLKKYRENI